MHTVTCNGVHDERNWTCMNFKENTPRTPKLRLCFRIKYLFNKIVLKEPETVPELQVTGGQKD